MTSEHSVGDSYLAWVSEQLFKMGSRLIRACKAQVMSCPSNMASVSRGYMLASCILRP